MPNLHFPTIPRKADAATPVTTAQIVPKWTFDIEAYDGKDSTAFTALMARSLRDDMARRMAALQNTVYADMYRGGDYDRSLRRTRIEATTGLSTFVRRAQYSANAFIKRPNFKSHPPEIARALLWGPDGAFVGLGLPTVFDHRTLSRSYRGSEDDFTHQEFGPIRFCLKPLSSFDRYHVPQSNYAVCLHSPEDLIGFCRGLDRAENDPRWTGSFAQSWGHLSPGAVRIVLALTGLPLKAELFEGWIKAMRTGGYAFGFGLLRDEDDQFDPFGVLADLAAAAWTLDPREGGYAVDGSPFFLTPERLSDYLGIERAHAADLTAFRAVLVEIADSAKSFQPVIDALTGAINQLGEMKRFVDGIDMQSRPALGALRAPDLMDGLEDDLL